MSEQTLVDNYPGERTLTETARLHAQHDLVVDALGGLVLCPFDTKQPNLRILDIGTADGWYLHQLRNELTHPDSATLIGTDVAPYPDAVEQIVMHNFKTPFADEWKGSFDLVQLRAVLANVPGDAAVDLVRRALQLVKPGGYIQLVDGEMPSGEVRADDKPTDQLFKRVNMLLTNAGLDSTIGAKAASILETAGGAGIADLGSKEAQMRIGKDARLESTSWDWIRGMCQVVGTGLVKTNLISEGEMDKLRLAVFEESRNEGFGCNWYAAWAKKVA